MTEQNSLAKALAAFQAELPKLVKDEQAKVKGETRDGRAYDRSYGYADLAQVVETVLPVLGKHGLSITAGTVILHSGFVLEVTLLHESGEQRTGVWPLPDPSAKGVGPQDIGSAMTYGRRYLTLALSGAYPGGEDDDGARAQANVRPNRWEDARSQEKPVSAPPAKDWTQATDDEVQEMHTRIETLELAKAVNGYDWMARVGLHERKIPVAGEVYDPEGPEPVKITATELLAARLADEAVKPGTDLSQVAICREYAEDRGLLKVMVSETTTLDEELAMARDLLVQADVAQAKADTRDASAD